MQPSLRGMKERRIKKNVKGNEEEAAELERQSSLLSNRMRLANAGSGMHAA